MILMNVSLDDFCMSSYEEAVKMELEMSWNLYLCIYTLQLTWKNNMMSASPRYKYGNKECSDSL